MKSIAFLITEDWYFYSHRINLAKAAIKEGFKVYLLSNVYEHKNIIEANGVTIIPLKFLKRSRINVFFEFFSIIEIFLILKKIKPNILHSVALKPVIYGSIVSVFLPKIKNINALGGLGFIFSSGSLKARILKPIIFNLLKIVCRRKRNKIIIQNKYDYLFVINKLGIKKQNVSLIEGAGVDINKFSINKSNIKEPTVLLASRMIWDKGINEFVKAAKVLNSRGLKAKFILVGKPDKENPRSIPESQLNKWNQLEFIDWLGYQSNMVDIFKKASIVTLPSFYGEGIPKVLIEAMACSLPIITTNMPGCRDLVEDHSNGILVRAKDHIDLANAFEKLICDPSLCEIMGLKGREMAVKKYNQQKICKETMDLYLNE